MYIETMNAMTKELDLKRYGQLLAKAVPRVIRTEEENERALVIVESLLSRTGRPRKTNCSICWST